MATLEEIRAKALDVLGIPHLYSYQEEIILGIIQETRNRLVLLPTGAGKSLCFTLPALFFGGLTVLVYPLLALMDDQARRFQKAGISALTLRGGQTKGQRRELWKRLSVKHPPLLITNPEMLIQAEVRLELGKLSIDHLVFDEAHCIDQWGKTFRPAYAKAAATAHELQAKRMTALTATASSDIQKTLASTLFRDEPYCLHRRVPDRPNIFYEVRKGLGRRILLLDLVREESRPLLVFVSSRIGACRVAQIIAFETGLTTVKFYHAGLSKNEKTAIERWFFSSTDGILVSTCAYGLGVDKPDIRTVVHWDPAESLVAYLQESGRAGRDGKPARAILLDSPHSRFREEADRMAARNTNTCRRSLLLQSLGPETAECTGCDVCAGTRRQDRNTGLFPLRAGKDFKKETLRRWSLLFWGRPVPEAAQERLHLRKGWGLLREHSLESIEEMLKAYETLLEQYL